MGLVYTDRIEGRDPIVWREWTAGRVKGAYSAQLQLAGSRTSAAGVTTTAPLVFGRVIANGRTFGFRATFNGSDPDFRARSGFFPRPGYSHANFQPRCRSMVRRGA